MEWLYVASLTVAGLVAAARFGLARRHQRPYNWLSLIATVLVVAPYFAVILLDSDPHRPYYPRRNCGRDAKSLGMSLLMYSNDHDGLMPTRQPLTSIKNYEAPRPRECLADETVKFGVNAALLGQNLDMLGEREDILLAAETRRTDELVQRDADLALPHDGLGAACMTNGFVRFLPLDSSATVRPLWRDGVPAQLPPVRPDRLSQFRPLWDRLVWPIFFAGLPVSIVAFFRVPKDGPRRQFWRWAIWIWAALFALGLAMPVFV